MPRGSSGFRRLAAIVTQRCPRCLQGQVFATLFHRPSPATGHDADMRDVSDLDLGYDDEKFPYKSPQRGMRPTCRAGLLRG